MCTRSFLSIALVVACTAVAVHAQTAGPHVVRVSQADMPVIKANTHAVVVDVVVTKGQDEAVNGLRKQDFQLMEDGKPQSIDFFEEHTAASLPAGAIAPLAKMPPNVYTNVPSAPPTDSVNVLLLDLLNTDRQDQSYVHQQISNYLKGMQTGGRVAIFTLSTKLRMIQGFTADSAVLRSSLDDKKNGVVTEKVFAARSLQDKQDDNLDVGRLEMIQAGAVAIQEVEQAQANLAAYQNNDRVLMTLEALQSMGRYLAAIPGRKNLIWFSSSFPVTVFPVASEKQPLSQMREYTTAIKTTADLLTLSKVAVYPIGAEGLINEHLMESNNPGPDDAEGSSPDNRIGPGTSQRQQDRFTPYDDEHAAIVVKMAAMEQLASDTGGEAIFNSNDLSAAMGRAIHNGAHYYTVIYTPSNKKMDGQYRRVDVKLVGAKYKLAYRRGYYADERDKIALAANDDGHADPLRPLLGRGMPSSTEVLYGVRVAPASPQPEATAKEAGLNTKLARPTARYTVDFLIDSKKVQLKAAADGRHTGMIRVELLAYDRDGKALNWTSQTMGLNLDVASYAGIQRSGIPAHLEIDLPQADVYLATGIYDFQGSRAGTLEVPVTVTRQ